MNPIHGMNLIHGDCLSSMTNLIASGNKVDAIITDPPYGIDYQSNRRAVKRKADKIANDSNLDWLDDFLDMSYQIMNDDTAIYMFCSWHHIDKFKAAFDKRFKLKNILVWIKNNHGAGDLQAAYAPKHEFILYGHKGRSRFRGGRTSDVILAPSVSDNDMVHPTEKNINMLELFIRNNTDAHQLVLDPFMGSGTTGVAAKSLDRNFIGIEINREYYDIAVDRIKYTGRQKQLLD